MLDAHARALDPDDAGQATRRRAARGYVEANRRVIANHAIVPLASSGPMEKAVDITICRRFKTRGMSWFPHRAWVTCQLRLVRLTGGWERHWADRWHPSHVPGRSRPDPSQRIGCFLRKGP